MLSKEENILKLFFDNPTKEWHFEEIVKAAKIARSKANDWLNKFIKNSLIKKTKPKNKMPYYVSCHESPEYRIRKRLFALDKLNSSGLLKQLESLKNAKTIILFGSFSRSDWYKDSDIDIFIYGDPDGLKIAEYEKKLGKDIQLFICKDKRELSRLGEGLIKNIIKGNLIKGDLDFFKVTVNA